MSPTWHGEPEPEFAPLSLAGKLRAMKGQDLEEGVSTRLVIYTASLIAGGMPIERAIRAAMIEPLTDDPDVIGPLKFLREREIVHFQRFGECLGIVQDYLDQKRVFAPQTACES